MDDDLSALQNLHNNFGFSENTISQELNPSNKTWHSVNVMTTDISKLGEAVPDFISDHGSPNSPTSSLITPTQPLSGQFMFPPSYTYQTSFPSEGWFPSYPDSACMSFAYPNPAPPPYLPTWSPVPQDIPTQYTGLMDHSTLALTMPYNVTNHGVPVSTPHTTYLDDREMFGSLLHGLTNPPLPEHPDYDRGNPMSTGKGEI